MTDKPQTIQDLLQDPGLFFGRSNELREIATYLRGNQSLSIVGPLAIGKSSLLLHLMRAETLKTLELGGDNLFVYIDCQKLSNLQQVEILTYICHEVSTALEKGTSAAETTLVERVDITSWASFEALLRKLCQRGFRLVFILDDVDYLMMNPNLEVSFFNALRSLAGRLRVVYLTASEKPLVELTSIDQPSNFLSSPFFNIFAQIYLGLFSETEANNLIQARIESAGKKASVEILHFINQLVGRHPFALQVGCTYALDNPQDLPGIEQRSKLALEKLFQYYWESLSLIERDVLIQVEGRNVRTTSDPKINSAIKGLERKCLVVQDKGYYQCSSKILAEFITTMV